MRSNKWCIGFNFKHEYKKMSQGGKREKFWKRGLKATTSARFRRQFRWKVHYFKKKRGDPVLKGADDGRGQLGHFQRELVPVLARFPVLIVNLSIMNHFIEKFLFSNCFKYILEGDLSDSIETGCLLTVFSSKQNRTNRVDWVRLVRLSSVIELTEKFQLNLLRRKETKKI